MARFFRIRIGRKRPRIVTERKLVKILRSAKRVVRVRRVDPAALIIAQARKHLDVREQPPGSNRGPKIDKWLTDVGCPLKNPWCAAYASAMVKDAGLKLKGGGSASVYQLRVRAIAAKRWRGGPRRGYLACLKGDVHVAIVERVQRNRLRKVVAVHTIEGNTSSENGSNYNGGEVARHVRLPGEFSGYVKTY